MQVNITGHHVDVTDSLKDYVEKKLGKIERHYDQATNVHIVLTVERTAKKAEATVHVRGNDLFADASHDDMYAAIDSMMSKLDRQIRRHKEKTTDHHRGEGGMKVEPT